MSDSWEKRTSWVPMECPTMTDEEDREVLDPWVRLRAIGGVGVVAESNRGSGRPAVA